MSGKNNLDGIKINEGVEDSNDNVSATPINTLNEISGIASRLSKSKVKEPSTFKLFLLLGLSLVFILASILLLLSSAKIFLGLNSLIRISGLFRTLFVSLFISCVILLFGGITWLFAFVGWMTDRRYVRYWSFASDLLISAQSTEKTVSEIERSKQTVVESVKEATAVANEKYSENIIKVLTEEKDSRNAILKETQYQQDVILDLLKRQGRELEELSRLFEEKVTNPLRNVDSKQELPLDTTIFDGSGVDFNNLDSDEPLNNLEEDEEEHDDKPIEELSPEEYEDIANDNLDDNVYVNADQIEEAKKANNSVSEDDDTLNFDDFKNEEVKI